MECSVFCRRAEPSVRARSTRVGPRRAFRAHKAVEICRFRCVDHFTRVDRALTGQLVDWTGQLVDWFDWLTGLV